MPTTSDVKSRALRTLAQNLLFDVLLAVVVVVLPLVQDEKVDYHLILGSAAKTAFVTALAFLQRTLEARRTTT
ncbi:hypothetical protein GCM10012275_52620 [Longimycelium tulufanense]|uniref:Uncharacterized protein n=1 Tax=Longimycelium tulufanense TaxID=907463 RepID=A0A8J3FWY9_9PSEU|nr:hypothetical protein [Longimycelium tulufanense]GGM75441.1 hypothetical protein GCM10012275_52620 [Longimycelium tulufanense]